MKKILLLCLIQVSSLTVFGQYTPTKNSMRIGVDLMTVSGIDALGLHYQARYAKHLASDRLLLALWLGYFQRNTRQFMGPSVYAGADTYRRLTTDLSILVDLLPSTKSALRVGGGLSYWYRSDNILTGGSYSSSSDRGIYNVQTNWMERREWTWGYHLTLEYEKRLNSELAINGRVGWADFTRERLFQSAQAGLGISYLF